MQREFYGHVGEDGIDYRVLVTMIIRRWKTVIGTVVLVVAIVGVLNTFFIPPTFESSTVVAFRNDDVALEIDFYAFQALSSSPTVMKEVLRITGVEIPISELLERFDFEADTDARLMRIKVRAEDPYLAEELANAWIVAVQSEVARAMRNRLSELRSIVEANYDAALQALTVLEDSLAIFDSEYPISVMEARLQRDSQKLVSDEGRLENLRSLIPVNEATVDALKEVLNQESATFDSVYLLQSAAAQDVLLTQLNPTYLDARRRVAELESALVADRMRIKLLEEELPGLQARVVEAGTELVNAKLQRERLVRSINDARSRLEATRRERDEVLALERQLSGRSRVDVISVPFVPDRPIAPRKLFNLVLGALLGFMIAVVGVLASEWWKSRGGVARAYQI